MMEKSEALAEIGRMLDVSRETLDRLAEFVDLLEKWNRKINLVSPATIPQVWDRHILDSAQLAPLIPQNAQSLVDIGTGGGFPGLILAILGKELRPDMSVTMIESDARKCAFLTTASATLDLKTKVITQRIEAAPPQRADVVTSRALAPLPHLLSFADRHLMPSGTAIFMKGANVQEEVDESLASWEFDLQKIPSITNAEAVVLQISNLRSR